MLFCITSFFRRGLRRVQQVGSGHDVPLSHELARELEDLRKFSLHSLMIFLGIHWVAGSETLGLLTLALLIYTTSLHLAMSASFLQNFPILSRSLHAIPFLGISTMATVEFLLAVRSPALAVTGLLLGILPLLIIAVHHAKQLVGVTSARLPVRMHEAALPSSTSS